MSSTSLELRPLELQSSDLLRPLGAFEELFCLFDQHFPTNHALAAQITGHTTVQQNRGTDLISTLVAAEEDGEHLSEREIISPCHSAGLLAMLRPPICWEMAYWRCWDIRMNWPKLRTQPELIERTANWNPQPYRSV